MKRFHVHLAVEDLEKSLGFYSALFGEAPSVVRADYAKWMLEDPRLNFAISLQGEQRGIDHVGLQVDTEEELERLKGRAEAASGAVLDQGDVACCYASSRKHWTVDPQGLAWEQFRTMAEADTLGPDRTDRGAACCVPRRSSAPVGAEAGAACCDPSSDSVATGTCCT